MFSRIALISLEELKQVGTRVALYTAVAYATVRLTGFVVSQTSRLMGLEGDNRRS